VRPHTLSHAPLSKRSMWGIEAAYAEAMGVTMTRLPRCAPRQKKHVVTLGLSGLGSRLGNLVARGGW
jgi:hypothetical protein